MRTKVLAVSLALVSCGPPTSVHPLSDPQAAKIDSKLMGSWRGTLKEGGDVTFLHVMEKEAGHFDMVMVGQDGKKGAGVLVLEGFATELGGKKYLNLKIMGQGNPVGGDWKVQGDYLFASYTVSGGSLSLSIMDEAVVGAAVKAGKLAGHVEKDDVVITAETAPLVEFVKSADAAKLFKAYGTFKALR